MSFSVLTHCLHSLSVLYTQVGCEISVFYLNPETDPTQPSSVSMDPWPLLPSPPNLSLPEPLYYDSYFPGNESDLGSRNDTPDETHQAFDKTSSVVITFIYFTVCAVGLTGNTLVIYVILRYAKMKTVTNIYILNLAVADVLCMLSLPFIAMQLALVHWPFGAVLCRLVMTVDSLNQFTSIFCLMVMSVDRYLAVVHPIKSTKWRKPRVAKIINLTVWGVSLLVNLPIMIFSGLMPNNNQAWACTIVWPEPQEAYQTAFMFYTFLLGFFLPLIVICLCYLLIIIKVSPSSLFMAFYFQIHFIIFIIADVFGQVLCSDILEPVIYLPIVCNHSDRYSCGI